MGICMKSTLVVISMIGVGVVLHTPVFAVSDFDVTSGDWNTASNWDPSGVPTSSDDARIGQSVNPGTANIADSASGTTDDLDIGSGGNSNGTLNLGANATLTVTRSMDVGTGSNAIGVFNAGDNSVTTIATDLRIGGSSGVGSFTLGTGATVDVGDQLILNNGTYTVDVTKFNISTDLFAGSSNNEVNATSVTQQGGSLIVRDLQVGTGSNNTSSYDLNGQTLTATRDVILGENDGQGDLFLNGGTLNVGVDFEVRNRTYTLDASSVTIGNAIKVGNRNNEANNAYVTQSNGNLTVTDLEVGTGANNFATYDVGGNTLIVNEDVTLGENDGMGSIAYTGGGFLAVGRNLKVRNNTQSFTSDQISIDNAIQVGDRDNPLNDASLTLTGSFSGVHSIELATARNTNATLNLVGTLEMDSAGSVRVSNHSNGTLSHGTLVLGNTVTSGVIRSTNAGSNLFLRQDDEVVGTVRGWGGIEVGGDFEMDGQIIADGGPTGSSPASDRTLDITYGIMLGDTLSTTQGDGSRVGYYATNRGRLILDTLAVAGDVTWGDVATDTVLDIVNSVRFEWSGLSAGDLDVALLADDHSLVTSAPNSLVNAIGIFDIDFTGGFSSVDLTVLYDSATAVNENDLKFFHRDGGAWVEITSTLNTGSDLITANAVSSFSQFAIAEGVTVIPEPASFAVLALGGILMTGRTKRVK